MVSQSRIRDRTHVLGIGRQILTHWATREVPVVGYRDSKVSRSGDWPENAGVSVPAPLTWSSLYISVQFKGIPKGPHFPRHLLQMPGITILSRSWLAPNSPPPARATGQDAVRQWCFTCPPIHPPQGLEMLSHFWLRMRAGQIKSQILNPVV